MRKNNIPHLPNLRKRQRQQRALKSLGVFFIALLFSGAIIWGANNNSLIIINVNVSGAKVIDPKLIENTVQDVLSGYYFYFFPKANSLIYPREKVLEKVLEKFPRLSDAGINFVNFNTIKINVVERIPYGLLCEDATKIATEQTCYFFDDTGYIFDIAPKFFGTIYFTIFGPIYAFENSVATSPLKGTIFEDGVFEKIATLRDKLASQKIETTRMVVRKSGVVDLYMENGGRIVLSTAQDFESMFSNFIIALDSKKKEENFDMKNIEYIDTRFNNRIYFKFIQHSNI